MQALGLKKFRWDYLDSLCDFSEHADYAGKVFTFSKGANNSWPSKKYGCRCSIGAVLKTKTEKYDQENLVLLHPDPAGAGVNECGQAARTHMSSDTTFASLPLHHQLFIKLRDGGGLHQANSIADLHNISIDELKAHCRRAGEELIQERGNLLVYEEPVYSWAKSL